MNTTIEQRSAAREAALLEKIAGQRRLARPEDYIYDKSQDQFIDTITNTTHDARAVDASIPHERWRVVVEEPPQQAEGAPPRRGRPAQRRERLVPPSQDIMRVENDQFVEGRARMPGMPKMIRDLFINEQGAVPSPGCRIYNTYRPPPEPRNGDPAQAGPFIEHVHRLYPEPQVGEFFFDYVAHMLQRPHQKCSGALVLCGEQGIGKDTILYAVKKAVGEWNACDIDPDDLFSQHKSFQETTMLVVNEVRGSRDDFHASSLYNAIKTFGANQPTMLRLNEKYMQPRYVPNLLRLFLTTNNALDLHIPADDRRMFVMQSKLRKGWHVEAAMPNYFRDLYAWIENAGWEHVAAWLLARDLSKFDPGAEPPKTEGWGHVAGSWCEPDDGVSFALDALGRPDVVFGQELVAPQFDHKEEVQAMLNSPRKITHRMQRAGYVLVQSSNADGRWVFKHGEQRFRSRLAFANRDLAEPRGLIEERGRLIAETGEKQWMKSLAANAAAGVVTVAGGEQ